MPSGFMLSRTVGEILRLIMPASLMAALGIIECLTKFFWSSRVSEGSSRSIVFQMGLPSSSWSRRIPLR